MRYNPGTLPFGLCNEIDAMLRKNLLDIPRAYAYLVGLINDGKIDESVAGIAWAVVFQKPLPELIPLNAESEAK